MSHEFGIRGILRLGLLGAALLVAVAGSASAALEERATFSSDRLTLRNVIGEIRVEGGGSEFQVLVTISGRDAKEGLIELDKSDDQLEIRFPPGQKEYVYPRLGRGSDTSFGDGDSGWMSRLLGSGRVRVRGAGSGMELWADVTVRVPSGASLEVEHGVGQILASNVDGELELSTRSGDVKVEDIRGDLAVATGSGDVGLIRVSAERFQVSTGSGEVTAEDCDAQRVQVATGSGDIQVGMMRGRAMKLATGSGDVEARTIEADEVQIGTGSGDVGLELDRVIDGEYSVGTGSGDITLKMPAGASADVHAETDGGRITVDLAGEVQIRRQEPEEVRLSVGGGGASVDLGSGSGDIRIQD
jgi:hypothetical protein